MNNHQSQPVLPRKLVPGDTVGVVAPSSPFDKQLFQRGIDTIHQMGFDTRIDQRAFDGAGYLAGEDDARAAQLNDMFADDDIHAVMCARGGYGALRILERLDYPQIAANPKPLIGFSDITALHQAIYARCRMVTFHGPTVTTLWKSDDANRASWYRSLTGSPMEAIPIARSSFLIPGAADGVLVGGNLTVLSHLIGTRFWVPLSDKVLFIEDTGEAPYRIDRMLFQMKLAGLLDDIAGVVVGSLDRCGDIDQIHHMMQAFFDEMGVPVAVGLPCGHGDSNLTLALGARVRLDSDTGMLAFPNPVIKE